jgi:hypothetical protein
MSWQFGLKGFPSVRSWPVDQEMSEHAPSCQIRHRRSQMPFYKELEIQSGGRSTLSHPIVDDLKSDLAISVVQPRIVEGEVNVSTVPNANVFLGYIATHGIVPTPRPIHHPRTRLGQRLPTPPQREHTRTIKQSTSRFRGKTYAQIGVGPLTTNIVRSPPVDTHWVCAAYDRRTRLPPCWPW